jgi:hypothetical protein
LIEEDSTEGCDSMGFGGGRIVMGAYGGVALDVVIFMVDRRVGRAGDLG